MHTDLGQLGVPPVEIPRQELRLYHISRPDASHYGSCEGSQLTGCIIDWLDITYLNNPPIRSREAMGQLRATLDGYMDRLNVMDLRETMSTRDMTNLIRQLNTVFFAETIPLSRLGSPPFKWTMEKHTLGECEIDENYKPTVFLHPCMVQDYDQRLYPVQPLFRAYDRLNTLLHELCHAFILVYVRPTEPSCDDELGLGGHGTPWQYIAAKIEEVADKALGMKFDLDRVLGLMLDQLRYGRISGGFEEWERFQFDKTMIGRCLQSKPELLKPATRERARAMKSYPPDVPVCDSSVIEIVLRVLDGSWTPI